MPMIPFIGVRISWLILARKSDFARFAASASSRACSAISRARSTSCTARSCRVSTRVSQIASGPTTPASTTSSPSTNSEFFRQAASTISSVTVTLVTSGYPATRRGATIRSSPLLACASRVARVTTASPGVGETSASRNTG